MRTLLSKQDRALQILFALALLFNVVFWLNVRHERARWMNVPPAPAPRHAAGFALNDAELAYRANGLMIQNLGDVGGRSTALTDYDYQELVEWFFLEDYLNPHSNFIPYLAAYYFGAVPKTEKLAPLVDYLRTVGQRTEGQKWRWLAQAVFLARFVMHDMDKAQDLAVLLADLDNPDMPGWTRQMSAFVMNARGEKEAAYALMLEILKTRAGELHPNEVTNMRYYICGRILEPEEAKTDPLCENLP